MSSNDPDTSEDSSEVEDSTGGKELKADEVYCTSCGEVIKEEAEICPECGVRQFSGEGRESTDTGRGSSGGLPDSRVYELQKLARKDVGTAIALGFLLTPAGYWYVDEVGLAVLNFLTFNYLLLGFIIVPIHSRKIIKDARQELEVHGETW